MTDFWDRRARGFALAAEPERRSWFEGVLEPWLSPSKTLIDVGAGTGVLAGRLAPRLRSVTAVEPSPGMRRHMPTAPNLTVIGRRWEEADTPPADLVTCVNVLHAVRDPAPFVAKLEAAAVERVLVVMRDSPHTHPADRLAPGRRPPQRLLRDAFTLLRGLGIAPDVTMSRHAALHRFESLDAAVEECRLCLGGLEDAAAARAWLAANTTVDGRGCLVYDGGEVVSGVLHWSPAR